MENEDIIEIDGMPCIKLDSRIEVPFQIFQIEFVDFTSLQQIKKQNYMDKILQDLEKLFKGKFKF